MRDSEAPAVGGQDASIDRQAFRDAMSRYATSVHVVTTDGLGGRCGVTVTAVASLSDTPPTVLVCVNRASRANAAIKANRVLCINTLGGDGAALSDAFAGRGGLCDEDRFALGQWTTRVTGAPVLTTARVAIDARLERVVETETHSILFARIVDGLFGAADAPALVHLDRGYRTL